MPDRKWKRCQNVAHHRAVCLMHGGQNLGRMGGGGRCHLCPLLSHRCLPPPDMSTLVKSWPYRELYGLIGAPLRWDRARHVFVVEQREACVEVTARSPSIWSGILFLGGSGHPVPSHTPPAKQQPKEAASCRRSIVGFREWAADSR